MNHAKKVKDLAAALVEAAENRDSSFGLLEFLRCRDCLHAAIDELQTAHDGEALDAMERDCLIRMGADRRERVLRGEIERLKAERDAAVAKAAQDAVHAAMYRHLRSQEIGTWFDLKSRVYSLTLRVPVGLDFVPPSADALDTAIRETMKGKSDV